MVSEDALEGSFKLNVVFAHVVVEFFSAQHSSYLLQLVVVVAPFEERLFVKNHASHHHPQGPDVEGVVVKLVSDQQLWSLEVPRTDPDVVVFVGQVKLAQAPVDDSQLHGRQCTVFLSWSMITFWGLTSRCMMPMEWA